MKQGLIADFGRVCIYRNAAGRLIVDGTNDPLKMPQYDGCTLAYNWLSDCLALEMRIIGKRLRTAEKTADDGYFTPTEADLHYLAGKAAKR